MTKQKTTWSQVKKILSMASRQDLIGIIGDLYKLNADNKVFLNSNLNIGNIDELAEPYRRKIKNQFNPTRGYPKINLRIARKALNDFKKSSADVKVTADLMIYYVEQGVQCTLNYGDVDESFYNSLESVFVEVIELIVKTKNPDIIEEFRFRLEKIVSDTSGIGWGFHDYLSDVFYTKYPQI